MARVGLVVPSPNTVMEADLYRRLPAGATLHTARMYMVETTPEGESAMLDDHLPGAIRDLASARPDVVVFGCTSAGALRGLLFRRHWRTASTRRRAALSSCSPAASACGSALPTRRRAAGKSATSCRRRAGISLDRFRLQLD